jgi:hypothetical protein
MPWLVGIPPRDAEVGGEQGDSLGPNNVQGGTSFPKVAIDVLWNGVMRSLR